MKGKKVSEMQEIWKYKLEPGTNTVTMPNGAKILCVQTQSNAPVMWALVDPNEDGKDRVFEVVDTGWPFPDNQERKYIGTFQLDRGFLVFHVFEIIELPDGKCENR